jgi:anti-sigma factor RsiW
MNDRADDIHEWDAAYVLGSLSATDRALFEAHLEGCDACMRSLAELSGLPGVLRLLPVEDALALLDEPDAAGAAPAVDPASADPAAAAPAAAARSASGHRVPRRRRPSRSAPFSLPLSRRTGAWLLAAAAIVLLAGGAGLGSALRAGVSAPVAGPTPTASATATPTADTGLPADAVSMRSAFDDTVTAQLAVTAKPWGTRFDWSCAYAGGGGGLGAYDLVAIARDGTRTVVASWSAGEAEATQLAATSSIPIDRIREVQITPSDSDVVLASRDL